MKQFLMVAGMLACGLPGLMAQTVTKPTVEGVRNLSQIESTVACAGAVTSTAIPNIKKMGFASIINLRQASEQGIDIEGETEAAKQAGIKFFHIPINGAMPDPASVDNFVKVITTPGNEPAFIHCASGNRAAAMWMVKRILVDKWTVEKASDEAAQLGLSSQPLKTFVLDYVKTHAK